MNASQPPRNRGPRPAVVLVLLAVVLGLGGILVMLRQRSSPVAGIPVGTIPVAGPVTPVPASTPTPPQVSPDRVPLASPSPVSRSAPGLPANLNTNIISQENFAAPGFSERVKRHLWVQGSLVSPARNTPEFRGIAALCERFGYEPWVITVAYNLAYERRRAEIRAQTEGNPDPPASRDQALATFRGQVEAEFSHQDLRVEPAFVEALIDFKPEMFVGREAASIARTGDTMLDGMGWAEWHARRVAEPPNP